MKTIMIVGLVAGSFFLGRFTADKSVDLTPKAKEQIAVTADETKDRIKAAAQGTMTTLTQDLPESPITVTTTDAGTK